MIETPGNILDSGAAALVNPVNCEGVSGAGLAKAFALRYPQWAKAYKVAARRGEIRVGEVWRHAAAVDFFAPTVYALPTKRAWRDPSRLEWIRSGLDALTTDVCGEFRPASIAIPALGCGLGGLDYRDVRPFIVAAAARMEAAGVQVLVFPPGAER